jgi:hypothetical protein
MRGQPPISQTTATICYIFTCRGSDIITTATSSNDPPVASLMLAQCLSCVAVHDWGNSYFLWCAGGMEHFDYSCWPSTSIFDVLRPPCVRAQRNKHPAASRRPADLQDGKYWANLQM